MKILHRNIQDVCVIGDIHSSSKELFLILEKACQKGIRKFISVGDIWDRGYDPNGVMDIIYQLYKNNQLDYILGNHDYKLLRHLNGTKVNIGEEQKKTLELLTQKSIDMFLEMYNFEPVAIYDYKNKIFISHAGGGRPSDILYNNFRKADIIGQDFTDYLMNTGDKQIEKKYAAVLLYGITNGDKNANGMPVRLFSTENKNDNLDGWTYIVGHYHSNTFHHEDGNPHVCCVDYCCGEVGGRLAGLIIREDGQCSESNLIFSY